VQKVALAHDELMLRRGSAGPPPVFSCRPSGLLGRSVPVPNSLPPLRRGCVSPRLLLSPHRAISGFPGSRSILYSIHQTFDKLTNYQRSLSVGQVGEDIVLAIGLEDEHVAGGQVLHARHPQEVSHGRSLESRKLGSAPGIARTACCGQAVPRDSIRETANSGFLSNL
jgi:hypothetical protein